MPTIAEVRKKYPQYEDLSDDQLAGALHRKFYSDMPPEEFAAKIGLTPESATSQNLRSELSNITQSFGEDKGDSALRTADSFVRGAADLATFGLADEISAGLGAATGIGGDFGEYDRNLNRQRIEQEIRDQRDPVASTVGRVAGGVGTGLGLLKNGVTLTGKLAANAGLGSRMAAGAAEGAAYGGAYGLGSGEGVKDRLAQGAGGAAAGAAIGGVIPPLVAGAKALARPITDAIGARTNPGAFASRKVAERLSASNMTPETIARKLDRNPGSAVVDVAGKSARDLLRTTVNIPGPAKDRVAKQVVMRQFGQGDRLKSALAKTFSNPEGYLTAKDDLSAAAKAAAKPLYDRAYAAPVHYSKPLEDILDTPAGKAALAKAQQLAANEQRQFRQIFININGQGKRVPDTQGWDDIKRAMDDMIEAQMDPITRKVTNEGRVLTGLKNRMLSEVDKFNPDYAQARKVFSNFAQIDDAMEFGRKSANMSPDAIRREMQKLAPTAKEAARIGRAEELRKAIDATGWTNNGILKIFNNRQQLQGLRAMFDSEASFAEFRKSIFQEARRRSTYDAVRGNSTTAAQLADMMEAGGTSEAGQFLGNTVSSGPVTAAIQWVGSRLRMLGGLTPEVADNIAKKLMTTAPDQARQLMSELSKIEASQLSAQNKARVVQQLLTQQLTTQSVGANARN